MFSDQPTAGLMNEPRDSTATRTALVKAVILFGLLGWAFWPQIRRYAELGIESADWAHTLVFPIAAAILLIRRRGEIAGAFAGGSAWGIVLLLLGLGQLAIFSWPFTYIYVRDQAIVPAAAGVVLAVGGWRVLKRSLPVLLLLALSIPISPRIYEQAIIGLETDTLSAAGFVLDQTPGVEIERAGTDLFYFTDDGNAGAVALGEPRRGASFLMTYVAIGVSVVFTRIRPFWQVMLMALAAAPLALLCNLLRIVCWGLINIFTSLDPVSPVPRAVAVAVSLLLAYVFFAAGCWILSCVVVESEEDEDADATEQESPAAS